MNEVVQYLLLLYRKWRSNHNIMGWPAATQHTQEEKRTDGKTISDSPLSYYITYYTNCNLRGRLLILILITEQICASAAAQKKRFVFYNIVLFVSKTASKEELFVEQYILSQVVWESGLVLKVWISCLCREEGLSVPSYFPHIDTFYKVLKWWIVRPQPSHHKTSQEIRAMGKWNQPRIWKK